MRILLLDQFSEMGGAQRCLADAAAGFGVRGWQVHAAVPDGELCGLLRPICQSIQIISCGPFHSGRKTIPDTYRFFRQLASQTDCIKTVLRRTHVDALFVNGPRLMPAAALAHNGTPVIFHCHSLVTQPASAALLRASIRHCRADVIASSRFVARPLAAASCGRLRVIPNGVRSCASTRVTDRRRPTVAVLGRIAREKGQLELVRAARILENFADLRCVIAGSPLFGRDAYVELVEREARRADVELTGWVNDVAGFLATVDLLIVCSTDVDATPRVIVEAFSAGTPVLAFAAGGIPEMIEHGENGLLIRQYSSEALAQAILDALRFPERLLSIAERARARWRELYTVERFQSDVCDAVQNAVERRHQRIPLARAGAMARA